jgi:hypothetical protein
MSCMTYDEDLNNRSSKNTGSHPRSLSKETRHE